MVDGELLGFVGKQYLAGDGIHYEPRWFKPWPEGVRVDYLWDGRALSAGRSHVRCRRRFASASRSARTPGSPTGPAAHLALRGVDMILNPSASHFAFGKHEVRKRFVLEGSRAFGVSYVYANLLGNEAGRAIYDGGALIASGGELLAVGPRFSFADQLVTTATIDVDATRMNRARTGSFKPVIEDTPQRAMATSSRFPLRRLPAVGRPLWPSERGRVPVLRDVVGDLGSPATRSRKRSSRAPSRSGCSTTCARAARRGSWCRSAAAPIRPRCRAWSRMMVEFGIAELGRREVPGETRATFADSQRNERSAGRATTAIVSRLLTCVYQVDARTAARSLATRPGQVADGARREVPGVRRRTAWCRTTLAWSPKAIGRELTWEQRRHRAAEHPGPRAVAERLDAGQPHGALLLATSNRSEAAVGYATMDGDTSGGLSPIAGIDKAFLRRWLRWMETDGPRGSAPIPALRGRERAGADRRAAARRRRSRPTKPT